MKECKGKGKYRRIQQQKCVCQNDLTQMFDLLSGLTRSSTHNVCHQLHIVIKFQLNKVC